MVDDRNQDLVNATQRVKDRATALKSASHKFTVFKAALDCCAKPQPGETVETAFKRHWSGLQDRDRLRFGDAVSRLMSSSAIDMRSVLQAINSMYAKAKIVKHDAEKELEAATKSLGGGSKKK